MVGLGEYSDMPMTRPPEGDTYFDFFKSKYTTQYLEEYIDHHGFAGRSLRDRIRFSISELTSSESLKKSGSSPELTQQKQK